MPLIPSQIPPKSPLKKSPSPVKTPLISIPNVLRTTSTNPNTVPKILAIDPPTNFSVSHTADPNSLIDSQVASATPFTCSQFRTTNTTSPPMAAAIPAATAHTGAVSPAIVVATKANALPSAPTKGIRNPSLEAIVEKSGVMGAKIEKNRVPKRVKNPVNFCHGPRGGGFAFVPHGPFAGAVGSTSAASGAPHLCTGGFGVLGGGITLSAISSSLSPLSPVHAARTFPIEPSTRLNAALAAITGVFSVCHPMNAAVNHANNLVLSAPSCPAVSKSDRNAPKTGMMIGFSVFQTPFKSVQKSLKNCEIAGPRAWK